MDIYNSFFFSNNKAYNIVHCAYLLSHSLSILRDLISVKIKVYRHLSPPSSTHVSMRQSHTHTQPGRTNCTVAMTTPLLTANMSTASGCSHIQSAISFRRRHGATREKCKGRPPVCGPACKSSTKKKKRKIPT